MIPCSDPLAAYRECQADIDAAIHRVLDSGWYILGDEVRAFEAEFAEYVGVRHGVGVGSGTEALHLALVACGVGPGDEVITVSHTAVATVAAIGLAGATPIFVDIDPSTLTMDPSGIEGVITPRTKAIVVVHLYGNPVSMNEIKDSAAAHKLYVIEDCAQAHGARYRSNMVGSLADIACFSFYPTKNLGAMGDAGAVVTDNDDLAEQVRLCREYGWADRFVSSTAGWNSRLDELHAAVLRVKLRHLDAAIGRRRKWAAIYSTALLDARIGLPVTTPEATHAYHLYVIRSQARDDLMRFLQTREIGVALHYPQPVHRQPAYETGAPLLPETDKVCSEILSLPMYPQLSEQDINTVVQAIYDFERQARQ